MVRDDRRLPLRAPAAADPARERGGILRSIGRWWRGGSAAMTLALGILIGPAIHAQQHRPVEAGASRVTRSATAAIGGPASPAGRPQGGVRFPVLPAGAVVRPPATGLRQPGLRPSGTAVAGAAGSAAPVAGTAGLAAANAGAPARGASPGRPAAGAAKAPGAQLASAAVPPSRSSAVQKPNSSKTGKPEKSGSKSGDKANSGNKSDSASANRAGNSSANASGGAGTGAATSSRTAATPAMIAGKTLVKDR